MLRFAIQQLHYGDGWLRPGASDRSPPSLVRIATELGVRFALVALIVLNGLFAMSEFLLVPKLVGDTKAVTVLTTRKRTGTVQARSLFTQLEVRGGIPNAATAPTA